MKLAPREVFWNRCWAHVGNLVVKLWDAPSDFDLQYFRSEEEFDIMTLAAPYFTSLLADPDGPPIDIRDLFPPLTQMSRYCTAHCWVRDDDFEHRFRCRHLEGGAADASMEIHVDWHNIELLGMTYSDRNI